jgi:hypothetical protein
LIVEIFQNQEGEDTIMAHSLMKNLRNFTQEHPLISSGLWFSTCAMLPIIPIMVVFIYLGFTFSWSDREVLKLLIAGIISPIIITALVGMLPGYKILCLPSHGTPRAAIYGLVTGLAVFLLWVMMLELLPNLPTLNANQNPTADLPGAAVIVAYLVVLPGLVIFVMAYGAVAGMLLHILSVYSPQGTD